MRPKPNNLTSLGHRVWSSLFDWSRRHPQSPQQRELQLAELEDRILFSAAPIAPIAPGPELMSAPAQTAELSPNVEVATADSLLIVQAADPSVQSVDNTAAQSALESGSSVALLSAADQRLELVFLDSHVADLDSIRADLQRDTPGRTLIVIELDASRNGLEQITESLEKYRDVSAIHVVSHGDDSAVQLGNTWLSLSNLGLQSPELTAWGNSLSPDADILFYGCDLAASDSGQMLLEAVGILTGADVAASTDATGAAILGGDWNLEYQSGEVETQELFSEQFEQNWDHLLQTAVYQNGLNSYTGTLDSVLDPSNPNSVNGGNAFTTMKIGGTDGKQGLLRFDSLFSGSGSIPASSTIENVTLTLDVVTPVPVGSTISLYRISTAWDANSTWNSLGSGIQIGTETRPVADITFTVTASSAGSITLTSAELQSTVQEWSNGQANWGWLIVTDSNQLLELRASEDGLASGRPQLAIEYSAVSAFMPTGELRVNPLTAGVETTAVRDRGSHDAIATAANGDYVVVYTTPNTFSGYTEDSTSTGVFAQRYNSLGIAQGAMIQVNQYTTGDQAWASVAMAADGSFAVTWSSSGQDGSQEGVYLRLFNADGTAKTSEIRVNNTTTLTQYNSSLAIDDAGNLVVVWQGYGLADTDGIYYRRFDSTGNGLDSTDRLANTSVLNAQYDPTVALSSNGTFAIAWDDVVGMHARRFSFSTGNAFDATQFTAQAETTAGNSDVAIDDSGNVVVVWRTTGSGDGSGTAIWGRRYSASTSTWQPKFAISQTVANNQTSPSIDMDASGNYIVVWEGAGPGDTAGVFARKFSYTDTPLSPEFQVNLTVEGTQGLASVAVRDLLNFVVAWTGNGPGDDSGVFVRQFGSSVPPSPSIIMSTANNVSGATVPGLTSWLKGDIIRFGEPNYSLGEGTTNGEFQWYGTANNAFLSPVDIDALHFVTEDILVGNAATGTYQLRAGDILYSIRAANTLTDGRTVNASDIMIFRPVTPGNYTLGTINYLFQGIELLSDPDLSTASNVSAFTLVEYDTQVGQTLLKAGDFLFAQDTSGLSSNIYWFHTVGAGAGATAGTADLLVDGSDLGITKKVFGLELIEATTTIGDITVGTGTLILTANGAMTNVAGIASIDAQDLFTLDLTSTTLDSGTAVGTGAILFDGSSVGLQFNQSPNAFSLVNLNTAPAASNDIYTVQASGVFNSRDTWFDANWQARQQITINNTTRNENLIDFPVLVTLDSSRINYSRTHGNGNDLRFVDGNGQELAYEIESWNPNGRSYVWVKIPQIDANSGDDFIWMYYDNAAAPAGQDPANVWTNGYVGVWHLNDALSGSTAINDSTANNKDGVATNLGVTDRISGIAGSALDFNGVDESIRIASSSSDVLAINGTEITIEAWAQRNADSADWMTLLGRQIGTGTSDSYSLTQVGGNSAATNLAVTGGPQQSNALPLNEWHYLTGVRSGTTATLYNNGILGAQATGLTGPISSDANDVIIGGQENSTGSTPSQLFMGYLDEIRISNVARSAAWTSAQYASMSDALLSYGIVQTYAGVLENDVDANGDSLSVVSVDTTDTVGTVVMHANGTFAYDPGTNFASLAAGQTAQTSFTYRVEDGHGSYDTATVTLVIQGANDAPVLTYSAPFGFDVNENDLNPPGHTISDLLATATSGSMTDADVGTSLGIAIVGADETNGRWQFSLDGTTWTSLTGASDTSATLLALNSQIRFVPFMHYAGPSGSLTFRAWDGSTGGVGDVGVNLGTWTPTSAVSQQTATIEANVLNVNDAPVGNTDSYSITEDTPFSSYSGWFDRAWSYRKALTFDNSARNEALVDFPVLVELNSSDFDYSRTQAQGQDLRFVDTNGTLLNYEIESWDPGGTSYVWVRVPQVDANSAIDFIWMYYGNASAPAGQNPTGVWSSAYDAVYHFGNSVTATGTVSDSTNQVNGTNVGSTSTTGFLGGGQSFDGVNDSILLGHNINLLDGASAGTISGWVSASNTSQNAGLVSIARTNLLNTVHDDSRAALELQGTQLHVSAKTSILDGTHGATTTTGPITSQTWHYVSAVIDYANDRMDVYVDGSLVLSQTVNFPGNVEGAQAENASIGSSDSGGSVFFAGLLDEIRIQSTGRSANWQNAEYANMTGGFVSVGSEQVITGVLSNDSDLDGDALTVTEIDGPAHAASFVLYANGAFDYTPAANYTGPDSFRYSVSDGVISSAPIVVNLNIGSVNDPPTVTTNSIPLTEGGSITLSSANLNVTDVDNTPANLTYTVTSSQHVSVLVNGSAATSFTQAQINSGSVLLVHDGTNNAPALQFTVSDGSATTVITTASFTFTAVNDAPTISAIANQDIAEDTQTSPLAFTIGDEETAATSLTVQVTSSNTGLVPNSTSNLVLSGTGASRTLTVIPTGNASGVTTITVSVSDGVNTTSTSFQLRVQPVNDPPSLNVNNGITVPEGGSGTISSSMLSTVDIDTVPGDLVYTILNQPAHGFIALQSAPSTAIGTFTQAQINVGNVIFVHDGSESTSDSFDFRVGDGTTSLDASFNISITPVNDPPAFTALQLTVTEGQTVTLTSSDFNSTDPDGTATTRTFSIVSISGGRFERNDGVATPSIVTSFTQADVLSGFIRFIHDGSNNATVISVRLSDGTATTGPQTVAVTFTSVNDAPTLSAFSNVTVDEDTPTGTIAFTIGDEETAASLLTVSATSSNPSLVDNTSSQLVLGGTGASRTLNVIPNANASGTTTITVSVSDGVNTTSQSFVLTVNAVDDAPVFANTSLSVTEGATVPVTTANLIVTDVDTPAANLTYTITATHGYFALAASPATTITSFTQADVATNKIVFVHDGSNTTPAISVQVTDGTTSIGPQTVAVTFTSLNDAPTLSAFSNVTVNEDTPTGNIAFTIGDEETTASLLTVSVTSSNTSLVGNNSSQLVLGGTAASRTLNVIPNANASGTTTITVSVSDGVNTTSKSFVLTVNTVDDAPVLVNASLSVTEGATVQFTTANLSVTDIDTSDANLTYTVTVMHGHFALATSPATAITTFTQADVAANSIVFVHDGGESAPAITVSVSDGAGTVGPVTMGISFTHVDDAPVVVNNQIPIVEGGTTTISSTMLDASDVDTSVNSLIYTVSGLQHVDILVSGMSSSSFTQADIDNGRVAVIHNGTSVAGAFAFSVSDGTTATPEIAAQISFNPVNDPPTVSLISDVVIAEDTATGAIGFVIGDSDTPLNLLTVTVTSTDNTLVPNDSAHLVLAGSGSNWSINVIPLANAFGMTTITVSVSDGDQTVNQTFRVTVDPVNDIPDIAVNQVVNVSEGGSVTIIGPSLLAVDVETPAAGLTYTVTSAPLHGHLAFASAPSATIGSFSQSDIDIGRLIYVHDGSETSSDTFAFSVTDGSAAATGTFTLAVDAVNDAPTIALANLEATEGGTVVLDNSMLLASDVDSSAAALTFSVSVTGGRFERTSAPGTSVTSFTQAEVNSGSIQFVDDGNETPPVISLTVTDGFVTTSQTTVSMTYHPVDDAPTVAVAAVTITEGQTVTLTSAALQATDPDTPPASLTYAVTSLQHVTVLRSGTAVTTFTQADVDANRITLVHDGSISAPVLEFALSDGSTLLPAQQQPFAFTSINDVPTLTGLADITISEDANTGPLAFTIADEETAPGDLAVTVTSSNAILVPQNAANLLLGGSGAGRTLTVIPASNESGTSTITVTVSDGVQSTSTSILLTVTPVNDAPVLNINSPLTLNEAGTAAIDGSLLSASDVDNVAQDIPFSVVTAPQHGRLAFAGSSATSITTFTQADLDAGRVVYIHDGSNTTADSFDFVLGAGPGSTTGTFSIQINAVNDSPVISGIGPQVINEDSQTGPLSFTVGDEETAPAALTVTVASSNAGLVPNSSSKLVLGGTGANRTINVIPAANGSGTTTITITVSDGSNSSTTSFDVQVNPVNDVPTLIANNLLTVIEGGSATLTSALLNTTDLETGPTGVTYSIVSGPANGFLARTSSPTVAITSFTQADVNANTVVYIHDGSQTTADTFAFTASDGAASLSGNFSILVTSVNNPPVIGTVQFAVTEGQSVLLNSSDWNSSDPDTPATGLIWSVVSVSAGQFEKVAQPGTAILSFSQAEIDNNQVRFVHDGSESAPVISVQLSDGATSTAVASVNVSYTAVNDIPTLTPFTDQFIDEDNSTGPLGFVIGDAETLPSSLMVTVTSSNTALVPNSTGSLVLGGTGSNRTLEVIPAANASGTTTITVSVSDGVHTTSQSFVLKVNSVDDAPVFVNASLSVTDGATVPVTTADLSVTDVDTSDANLTYTITATHGYFALAASPATAITAFTQADVAANSIVFVHDGSNAAPAISVQVTDGTTTIGPQTVAVTFTSVNDAPTLSAFSNVTVNEDTATGNIAFTIGDEETLANSLTVSVTSSNTSLVGNNSSQLVLGGTGASRTLNVIPNTNASGTTTITVTVTNGTASTSQSFLLQVSPVDDAPQIGVLQLSVTEGLSTLLATSDWSSTDIDTPTSELTWSIQSVSAGSFERVGVPGTAVLSFTQADVDNGLIRFVHDGSKSAPVIVVTLSDATTTSRPSSVNVSFLTVNHAPTISAVSDQSIAEDGATGPLGFVIDDIETPAANLSVTVTSSNPALVPNTPAALILGGTGSNRTIEVVPISNLSGSTTVTITVTDGTLTTQTSFVVNVAGVNDTPVMANQAFTVAENPGNGTSIGTLSASDADPADVLTFSIMSGNSDGAFNLSTGGILSVADGTKLDFETQPVRQLQVEVRDLSGATAQATVTVRLTNVNEQPALTAQSFSIPEDAAIGTVLGQVTATDPDASDTLTYRIIGGNPGGIFEIDGSGTLSLSRAGVLDTETQPTVSLTVEVRDAGGLSSTAAMTVTVTDVNEPVTASLLSALTASEDDQPLITNIASAFSDPDAGEVLTYRLVGSIPAFLSGVSLDASSGELTVSLAANQSGIGQIQIEATDSAGHTAIAVQEVRIATVNDAPFGQSDFYDVPGGETLTVSALNGVLANDGDIDSRFITAELVSGPRWGQLTLNTDGSFTYTPLPTQTGQTSFTYEVSDGSLTSEVIQVVLNVKAPKANGAGLLLTTVSDASPTVTSAPATPVDSGSPTTADNTSSSTPADSGNAPSTTAAPAAPVVVVIIITTDSDADDGTGVAAVPPPVMAVELFAQIGKSKPSSDVDGQSHQSHHASGVLDQILSEFGGTHAGVTIIGSITVGNTEIAIVPAQQLHLLLQSEHVWQQLDQTEELIESSGQIADLLTNTTTVTFSTSFTIGYVLWTLRGGVLLTTLFAQMPAWRMVDPLVVLENLGSGSAEDDESLEAIVQKGSEMEHLPEEGFDEPA